MKMKMTCDYRPIPHRIFTLPLPIYHDYGKKRVRTCVLHTETEADQRPGPSRHSATTHLSRRLSRRQRVERSKHGADQHSKYPD